MTDWPVKTLGEVCELVSRGRPPSYCEVGGVIVLNQKCVRNGQIDFGPSRRTDHSSKLIPEWAYVREGDILINSTGAGTLGRASFVSMLTEPTTFDTHLTVVRPRREICWPAFVGLFLNGREKDIVDLAGGATGQTELPREAVRSFEIPVPPLAEQKRIVALLDAANVRITELTASYEKARTHANDLFTSALCYELEGNPDWPVKTLGEVCELVSRGRPPSYCEVGGVIVLNQKCVRNGQIDFGPSRRTDHSSKLIPEWAYVREGDILINSTGAGTLGRASFVSMLTEPTTFDTHLTVVRPRREICWPAFVGLFLNGREKDIVDLAGGATGQTELPREAVRSFEIPVPPLAEQKRIVARLDLMRAKTSEMVAAYDAKLQAAKNLRQSILEAAFAGEL